MRRVFFSISFDALDTLIHIPNGVGYQYHQAYREFLQTNGISLEDSFPNATTQRIQELSIRAIRDQVLCDRLSWSRSANPKEMPIGGDDDATLHRFWGRVIQRVFTDGSLYEHAASPAIAAKAYSLLEESSSTCQCFEHHLISEVFGTVQAHDWLPDSRQTLVRLREWNYVQQQRCSGTAGSNGVAKGAVLLLAQPPFVVSNMDPRLHSIMQQLGAFSTEGAPELVGVAAANPAPLLSRVITAREVGYAKPSPAGLLKCVELASQTCGPLAEGDALPSPQLHVHVGDAEADRVACQRAECIYVQCDGKRGVVWEELEAVLKRLEESLWEANDAKR